MSRTPELPRRTVGPAAGLQRWRRRGDRQDRAPESAGAAAALPGDRSGGRSRQDTVQRLRDRTAERRDRAAEGGGKEGAEGRTDPGVSAGRKESENGSSASTEGGHVITEQVSGGGATKE